ncbi:TPA: hypothetical protein JAN94_16490 [Legionella pneumophila]|nr:hypothetical protein [Legionella pneumophila]HAT7933608.1 hypothetical protein [Legionella pneumophila]HAT9332780.1 hypothetical protein [Legionella pneumophila subsp. pneumophila]HAU1285294.1 hypothetical protein [Legionella pneumophila]
MSISNVLPRLIRLRDAPSYLGMDRHRFNEAVRPNLIEIPIGTQGVAFDRLDLDAWVDDYKQCSGRPAATNQRSMGKWDENEHQGFKSVGSSGPLTRRFSDADFAKALVLATSKRPKSILQGGLKK